MSSRSIGYVYVVCSAFFYGTVAIIAKYAYQLGINAKQLALVQGMFSAIVLWLIILFFCPRLRKIKKQDLKYLIGQGIMGSGLSSIFFLSAVIYLPASLASVLFFTYPIMVVILTIVCWGERVNSTRWFSLILALGGSTLSLGLGGLKGVQISSLGVGLALGAAFFNALLNIFAQRNLRHNHPLTVTAYAVLFSNINFFIFGWPAGPKLAALSLPMWLIAMLLSLLSTVFPLLLYFYGAKLIGVSKAAVVSTVELPFTILLAWLLLKESMTLLQVTGGILILAAVLLLQLEEKLLNHLRIKLKEKNAEI